MWEIGDIGLGASVHPEQSAHSWWCSHRFVIPQKFWMGTVPVHACTWELFAEWEWSLEISLEFFNEFPSVHVFFCCKQVFGALTFFANFRIVTECSTLFVNLRWVFSNWIYFPVVILSWKWNWRTDELANWRTDELTNWKNGKLAN